jgi:hypothetical protein
LTILRLCKDTFFTGCTIINTAKSISLFLPTFNIKKHYFSYPRQILALSRKGIRLGMQILPQNRKEDLLQGIPAASLEILDTPQKRGCILAATGRARSLCW